MYLITSGPNIVVLVKTLYWLILQPVIIYVTILKQLCRKNSSENRHMQPSDLSYILRGLLKQPGFNSLVLHNIGIPR